MAKAMCCSDWEGDFKNEAKKNRYPNFKKNAVLQDYSVMTILKRSENVHEMIWNEVLLFA